MEISLDNPFVIISSFKNGEDIEINREENEYLRASLEQVGLKPTLIKGEWRGYEEESFFANVNNLDDFSKILLGLLWLFEQEAAVIGIDGKSWLIDKNNNWKEIETIKEEDIIEV